MASHYLVDHGWIVAELGVHLSRADVVFLVAAVLGAALTWRGIAAGGA